MLEAWYALMALMVAMFLILDGWNIGAGILHHAIARSDAERGEVIRALGPAWSWNEVWLVAFGGVLFLVFPTIYAVVVSGFYFAVMMLLWSLVLRALGIELRHLIDDPLWHLCCDALFRLGSVLVAALLGAAVGNLVRGVPLQADGWFALPLFTDFGVRGAVGLLDWYTASVAALFVALLAAHGAGYLAVRARGGVAAQAWRACLRGWVATAVILLLVVIETWHIRPDFLAHLLAAPAGWAGILLLLLGVVLVAVGAATACAQRAFVGGCLTILAVVVELAVGFMPETLHSLGPGASLGASAVVTPPYGLAAPLPWLVLALLLAVTYLILIQRLQRGSSAATHGASGGDR
jgi:cytochrome d ubiquinol oxidase subunit II